MTKGKVNIKNPGKDGEWLKYIVDSNVMNCITCKKNCSSYWNVEHFGTARQTTQSAPFGRRDDCNDVEENVDIFSVLDPDNDKRN